MPNRVEEPWLSFLREVDRTLREPVEVHCLGGFVLAVMWGLPRPTGDIDVIEVRPDAAGHDLMQIAGEGTALAEKHHLHFQKVMIAEYPERYEERVVDITPRRMHKLRLKALEVHDVMLAKLSRNSPRDRADVEFLVGNGVLDRRRLQERFDAELRPHLLDEAREALTLELWLDEFFPQDQDPTVPG
ncbi:MAG: DUF6036 family nucleotidyltransferase [Acidobacteriota bacterium]